MLRHLTCAFVIILAISTTSYATEIPADINNDEGGPVQISGSLAFTNPLFLTGVSDPIILLEDQTGFIRRQQDYTFPLESQTLGRIVSIERQHLEYTIQLPAEPQAPLHHFGTPSNNNGGVMVFSIAFWANTFGDAYIEPRDQSGRGWSVAYASTTAQPGMADDEIDGGVILVYVPAETAFFPADFGADGRLFTGDEPLILLPQGYTVVNLNTVPFTFDRSRYARVDLLEGTRAAADDFSSLGYVDAFLAMLAKFREEYAFTEHKNINWSALEAEFLPRFTQSEANVDFEAYALALRDFLWRIPDGHVQSTVVNALFDHYLDATDGGVGMAIRELDDNRVIVNYVLEDGPADRAGIQTGAEILALHNMPVLEAVEATIAWSGPFSTAHVERLQKLRYATRAPLGAYVPLTFRNPRTDAAADVVLEAVAEQDSFRFSSFVADRTGYELPVMTSLLDSGHLYVRITSFSDDRRLTVDLWERMIATARARNVAGIIIDMRSNDGGSSFLADQLAAYFFNEARLLGNIGFYDAELDDFYFPLQRQNRFILPPQEHRYHGPVAVLIGPNCASACEFFAYNMTLGGRAVTVGQYATAGMGGSIEQFYMPGQILVQMTVGRAVDADGQVHIEGTGVEPQVRVPVDETTLFSTDDVVLAAAVDHLRSTGR